MRRRPAGYRTFRRTANRLRVYRVAQGWNQDDVARRLGLASKFRYWQIENDLARPTARERRLLAKMFKVTVVELFPSSLAA